ncbi:hypothetical protein RJT34_06873 [Clitoria ternatea]|uniref:Uncharacterized protein n=1 Tax=Clitoria ternatea TaxID=43366 RepID=A0AAN9K2X0_CLITE
MVCSEFQEFMVEAEVFDLPMHGRKLAWYGSDGSCISRLDRFLLFEGMMQVEGWGDFILKQKLKKLKKRLRGWHESHSQNLVARIKEERRALQELDLKKEESGLCEMELQKRKKVQAQIRDWSRLKASMLHQ